MTDSKEDKHALLSASGSSRWIGCPASINMGYDIEDETSEYAAEGIKAHKLASDEVQYWDKNNNEENSPIALCNDKEMSCFVELYIEYLGKIQLPDGILYLEQKVDFSNAVINGYGTADAIIINSKTEHLDIIDLKYGFNRIEAENNTQMLLYAIGAINSLYPDTPKTITLHIAQPRINNFDTWTLTYEELLVWIKYFRVQSVKALTLDNEFNPTTTNCKYCKAKKYCPALNKFVSNMTVELKKQMDSGSLFAVSQNTKKDLSNEFIKKVLDNSSLIKDYLSLVENIAAERLLNNQQIDGYKVVQTSGRRKLNADAESDLHAVYGDKIYQKTILGLGALEKVVGKKNLDDYTHKGIGNLAVVKDTDKRLSITEVLTFENIT